MPLALTLILLLAPALALGQPAPEAPRGPPSGHGPRGGPAGVFRTTVPATPCSLILGRPTASSVTLSVLTAADLEGCVRYGRDGAPGTNQTPTIALRAGVPQELILDALAPDTRYHYTFCARTAGTAGAFDARVSGAFHTQRAAGQPFSFAVTADSHLDENTDPAIYAQTLRQALADQPDFLIDLGDTFMTGKRRDRPETAQPQYLAQRYYFGLPGPSVPLYLVLGNHDGECGPRLDVATRLRTTYFPNPIPDAFYTGNRERDAEGACPQNYFAWTWGDALFVVLDPYRYSPRPARGMEADCWTFTLGRTQYDWLAATLERSRARFKFVFIHHLVGGLGRQGRGGAEAVPYGEWGGADADGRAAFAARRPGWPRPIHELLRATGVTAVFHGHDHFFARQEVDGILYQLVPQPGHPGEGSIRVAAEYGYRSDELRPGSGYLRVTVRATQATVDYVRTTAAGPVVDLRTELPRGAP